MRIVRCRAIRLRTRRCPNTRRRIHRPRARCEGSAALREAKFSGSFLSECRAGTSGILVSMLHSLRRLMRVKNFNAGPGTLPLDALERARDEMLDWEGTGMSVMEHSHRGAAYERVHDEAIALIRELLL